MTFEAAVFDLGGVVLDSPMSAIRTFERESGLPSGLVNRTVAASGADGAWARHERGELDRAAFLAAFEAEFRAEGHFVDTASLLMAVDDSIRPRQAVLDEVDRIRRGGVKVAALTNNWIPFGESPLVARFDVVVESVVEGTRKPERRIYEICFERLGIPPDRAVMFDDLGPNLKTARQMGATTVKVTVVDDVIDAIRLHFP